MNWKFWKIEPEIQIAVEAPVADVVEIVEEAARWDGRGFSNYEELKALAEADDRVESPTLALAKALIEEPETFTKNLQDLSNASRLIYYVSHISGLEFQAIDHHFSVEGTQMNTKGWSFTGFESVVLGAAWHLGKNLGFAKRKAIERKQISEIFKEIENV